MVGNWSMRTHPSLGHTVLTETCGDNRLIHIYTIHTHYIYIYIYMCLGPSWYSDYLAH